MKRYCIAIVLIFLSLLSDALAQEYLDVTPEYKPEFPRDFYYKKDYRVQWWYFTGHLFDEKGREFGYELTFFAVGVQKKEFKSKFGVNTLFISHFAVTDVDGKKYYFTDKADAGAFGFAGARDDELKVWVAHNSLDGTMDRMHLRASDSALALDLILVAGKPLVLNGESGYSRKSEESPLFASLYFSYTELRTTGTLTVGDRVFSVHGKSWFDREISTRGLSERLAGWDWFGIQLDDNREIMLSLLRKKDGSTDRHSSGTFVYENGERRHLTPADFSVTVLDYYRSKKTDAKYPSRWEIRVPSEQLTLRVSSLLEDQEFPAARSTGNYYWEGTCSVEGTATGRAYVEMTGY
jgi:predicted secreted hydrolase